MAKDPSEGSQGRTATSGTHKMGWAPTWGRLPSFGGDSNRPPLSKPDLKRRVRRGVLGVAGLVIALGVLIMLAMVAAEQLGA